jgi:ADP-heptose:LPS heptosyltransferase
MDKRSDSTARTILITRFSAVGDIAMTIPLLYSLCEAYPTYRFVFVSRERFGQFFIDKPCNLYFIGVNLDNYKGILGLYRLYRELSAQKPDMFADLHDVLRTKILRRYFKFFGHTKVATIDKGRKEKKELTRAGNTQKKQLKSTFERYRDVFTRLGLPFEPRFTSLFKQGKGNIDDFAATIPAKGNGAGKINLTLEERFVEINAIQEGSEPISTGAKVKVTAIVGDTLVVEKI